MSERVAAPAPRRTQTTLAPAPESATVIDELRARIRSLEQEREAWRMERAAWLWMATARPFEAVMSVAQTRWTKLASRAAQTAWSALTSR